MSERQENDPISLPSAILEQLLEEYAMNVATGRSTVYRTLMPGEQSSSYDISSHFSVDDAIADLHRETVAAFVPRQESDLPLRMLCEWSDDELPSDDCASCEIEADRRRRKADTDRILGRKRPRDS